MDDPISPDGTNLRVLLADDHEPFRHTVRKLLQKLPGCVLVAEAGDGHEVIRLVAELEPDVVIMDVVMPRLNGIEATQRIKREHPAIEVIALSVHGDRGFRRAMLAAGASTYLLKDNVGHALPAVLLSIAGRAA